MTFKDKIIMIIAFSKFYLIHSSSDVKKPANEIEIEICKVVLKIHAY